MNLILWRLQRSEDFLLLCRFCAIDSQYDIVLNFAPVMVLKPDFESNFDFKITWE